MIALDLDPWSSCDFILDRHGNHAPENAAGLTTMLHPPPTKHPVSEGVSDAYQHCLGWERHVYVHLGFIFFLYIEEMEGVALGGGISHINSILAIGLRTIQTTKIDPSRELTDHPAPEMRYSAADGDRLGYDTGYAIRVGVGRVRSGRAKGK